MQFNTLFSIALLGLAQRVLADTESFGMISIHSGTALQFASAYVKDGLLVLGSNQDNLSAVVTDAGKLKLSDNKYAVVQEDGTIKEGSESEASTTFGISSGRLTYGGVDGFYGIEATGHYTLSTKSFGSATGIAIRCFASNSQTGQVVPDFTAKASGDASSSAAAPEHTTTTLATSTTAAAAAVSQINDGQIQADTKTQAAAVSQITDGQVQAATKTQAAAVSQITDGQVQAATKAAVSQINDGQIQASAAITIQSENGATQYASGLTAAVFAAAALLL